MSRLIDLSQVIYQTMKVYPGHLKTRHMMCRENHITHYENLANLDRVVNHRFTFVGFPLRLQGCHGGPTRAVALVDWD